MAMLKNGAKPSAPAAAPIAETPKPAAPANNDNGTAAAIGRLTKTQARINDLAQKTYTGPTGVDDPKSERILRQGAFQHALVSPALAGMKFETMDQYLALVKEAAEKTIAMIKQN